MIHIQLNDIEKQVYYILPDLETAIILPIFLKKDNRTCTNYRSMFLLLTMLKLYERIIECRRKIEPWQSGFRRRHSIQDYIFTIRDK